MKQLGDSLKGYLYSPHDTITAQQKLREPSPLAGELQDTKQLVIGFFTHSLWVVNRALLKNSPYELMRLVVRKRPIIQRSSLSARLSVIGIKKRTLYDASARR